MANFRELRQRAIASNGSDEKSPVIKALLAPSMLAMIADSVVEDSELQELGNLCALNPTFKGINDSALEELLNECHERSNQIGREALLKEAAEALSPTLRKTALCFAIRLVMADGRVDDLERKMLRQIAVQLEIADQTYDQIFDAYALLQHAEDV